MYNLTFDTAYDRMIVRKLKEFQRRQNQPQYVPTNIEPLHLSHASEPKKRKGLDKKNK